MPKTSTIWARVAGFPWWPGRVSTDSEITLLSNQPQNKQKFIPITFYGTTIQRGWVSESSIKPFNSESISSIMTIKKLKTDQSYLDSIYEAIRIEIANGQTFADETIELIESLVGDVDWDRQDVCLICRGTEFSGDSLLCDRCGLGEIHLHCLAKPIIEAPYGDWYCPDCCQELKLPKDYMPSEFAPSMSDLVAYNVGDGDEEYEESQNKKNKKKRKSHKLLAEDSNESDKRRKSSHGTSGGTPKGNKKDVSEKKSTNSNQSVSSRSRERSFESQAQVELIQAKLQDFCFICRVENERCSGQLILCDFPGCYRAYHTVCISGRLNQFNHTSSSLSDDSWFCPAHFCSICCSLECPKSQILKFPLEILSLSLHLNSVPLQQCSTCPFSLCYSCQSSLVGSRGRHARIVPSVDQSSSSSQISSSAIFKNISLPNLKALEIRSVQYAVMLSQLMKGSNSKKGNCFEEETVKVNCCLNCTSNNPKIIFARMLEELWMQIGTNKLSEPFLRPFLPLDPEILTKNNLSKNEGTKTFHFPELEEVVGMADEKIIGARDGDDAGELSQQNPSQTSSELIDFFTILLSIRHLKYLTDYHLFLTDFNNLRDSIFPLLERYFAAISSSTIDPNLKEIFLQAFYTSTYQVYGIPKEKEQRFLEIQKKDREYKKNDEIEYKLLQLWRRECNLPIAFIRELYGTNKYLNDSLEMELEQSPRVIPRSLKSWEQHLTTSQNFETSRIRNVILEEDEDESDLIDEKQMATEAVDVLLAFNHSDSRSSLDASLTFNPWERAIENDVISCDYHSGSPFGIYGKTAGLLDRLHEITTTALHLQTQIKREFSSHENSILHPKGNRLREIGLERCESRTPRESQIVNELQLMNDNLRWKLRQQSIELKKSIEMIEKLSHENAQLVEQTKGKREMNASRN